MLGRHSTTSQQSMAKTSGSGVLRRCVTVNRSSATMWWSCGSERKKSLGHTERRYIVLYCWMDGTRDGCLSELGWYYVVLLQFEYHTETHTSLLLRLHLHWPVHCL